MGVSLMFTMADGYTVEDKAGIPYVYMCMAEKSEANKECYEARFEREVDGDKTVSGIRVKKYLLAAANATISDASIAKYGSPAEYFDAAVGAKKGAAKGERETEKKTADGAFVERAGGNMEEDIKEAVVAEKNGMIMVIGKVATGADVETGITELKASEFTGILGGWYKKRGADGADDKALAAEVPITFKFTEYVEDTDGGDGGDGGEDSAFAYSMAGVALATAALAF